MVARRLTSKSNIIASRTFIGVARLIRTGTIIHTITLATITLGTITLGTITLGTITLGTITLGIITLGTITLGTMIQLTILRKTISRPRPTNPEWIHQALSLPVQGHWTNMTGTWFCSWDKATRAIRPKSNRPHSRSG